VNDGPQAAVESVPTGNTYDKYGSANPIVRRLMAGFERDIRALVDIARPASILDVGCGEGVLTEQWARAIEGPVVGIDLDDPKLRAEWDRRSLPNLEFRAGFADALPFGDREFEAVTAMEVLEHVADPATALAEMRRVASRWLLVSVPREPLWRGLNLARGAYLKDLGNTPGHLSHWSKRSFARLVARYGEIVELRSPLPWTMALLRV
jgi:2-polyprenyl-3-methyl-5-hydroxy-6-metoxy-1,4-benzoquinol methylase